MVVFLSHSVQAKEVGSRAEGPRLMCRRYSVEGGVNRAPKATHELRDSDPHQREREGVADETSRPDQLVLLSSPPLLFPLP